MVNDSHPRYRGFTLIELLVVIAIIGILASVVLAELSHARGRARDAQRLVEVDQLAKAIELYRVEHGHYPCENASTAGCTDQGGVTATGVIDTNAGNGGLDVLLAPYLSSPILDPLYDSNPGSYYYYYDGRQSCTGNSVGNPVAVVFARRLEGGDGNASELCTSWGGQGGAGQPPAWHIILGRSAG